MVRAGAACADLALQLLGSVAGKHILVLAGPGNNGGDALIAAHLLSERGAQVAILPLFGDKGPQAADARQAFVRCKSGPARFIGNISDLPACPDLAIDGLFGIGLARGFDDALRALIRIVNTLPCPVLALDVPSGLNADTGTLVDEQGCAIRATHTLSFLGDKPGLHTGFGRDHAGVVQIADLEVEPTLFPHVELHRNAPIAFEAALPLRKHASHKGSHGNVAVIGGASGMSGAAILAARAAAFCGAGRVFVAMLDAALPYDPLHPELMLRAASDFDDAGSVLVVGPGLGRSEAAHALLTRCLRSPLPVVLDADALNLVATDTELQQQLAARAGQTLITPHPLEAARLLQSDVASIQTDRIAAARTSAARYACVVLLKGSGTVIARADGTAMINTTGNAALATAGSGDVLAGVCGALLAQGAAVWEAALAATWLHGAAADELVASGTGPIGVTASELLPPLRAALNRLSKARHGARQD